MAGHGPGLAAEEPWPAPRARRGRRRSVAGSRDRGRPVHSTLGRAERALGRGDSESALALLEPLDRTAEVLVLRGRAQALAHHPGEALAAWEDAAKLDPEVLATGPVLALLAEELGGSRAQAAGDLLARAGSPGRRALLEATRSDAYRKRWAAVEALRRAHADDAVDLREVYLADLRVRDCAVVVRAAGKLADLGEERAVEPLREISQRKAVLGLTDACEAPAARAALKKLGSAERRGGQGWSRCFSSSSSAVREAKESSRLEVLAYSLPPVCELAIHATWLLAESTRLVSKVVYSRSEVSLAEFPLRPHRPV